MNRNDILTDPKKLVRLELKNAGLDLDNISVPERVYLFADDIYDTVISRRCGSYKYPIGGGLYIFNENNTMGFVKGNICSAGIATQAEDLIASGVKELIHIGYAGGLRHDISIGDVVLTDGAFNDTAVARLYGYECDFIESTNGLTDEISKLMTNASISFTRGRHWTTDAGYRETWGQVLDYRDKGALCVEMEGAGLFTIAKYRGVRASAAYVISDTLSENGWSLKRSDHIIGTSLNKLVDMIVQSTKDNKIIHTMRLHRQPFEQIKSGKKTIELRLNDKKRQQINVGDIIEFISTEDPDCKISTRVVALHKFDSFKELYKTLPLIKCGYTQDDIHNANPDDMDLYYSRELQDKYGVLGIEIEIV